MKSEMRKLANQLKEMEVEKGNGLVMFILEDGKAVASILKTNTTPALNFQLVSSMTKMCTRIIDSSLGYRITDGGTEVLEDE